MAPRAAASAKLTALKFTGLRRSRKRPPNHWLMHSVSLLHYLAATIVMVRSTMRLREHHERTAPLAETCPLRPARLLTYTRVVRRHLAGRCATRVLPQQGGETTSSTREKPQRQLSVNSSVRSALATHHEN